MPLGISKINIFMGVALVAQQLSFLYNVAKASSGRQGSQLTSENNEIKT